nr:hypothetical protein [Angustibacter aerolatus]
MSARVVVVGGGPGGYESALVAAQARRRGRCRRPRRAGRRGRAHRLRAEQDAHLDRRLHEPVLRRQGPRGAGWPARPSRVRSPAPTCRPSTSGSSRWPAPRATTSPAGSSGTASAYCAAPAGWMARSASSPTCSTAGRRPSTPTSCCSPPAPGPARLDTAQPDGERILTWQQALRPARPARARRGRRLRRHRRRARARLPRPRQRRHPGRLPRPRAARRGRRRRPGDRGRVPPPRHDRVEPLARGLRHPHRRRRGRRGSPTGAASRARTP